jgi:hypothetical protein
VTRPLVIERQIRIAPFGLRLWDPVAGRAVSDGISVTLIPHGRPDRRIAATRNASGVFVGQNLPGLRAAEFGDTGFPDRPASPAESRAFRVEVRDASSRFHDVAFDADLPVEGLFEAFCGSPPSPPEGLFDVVPLFSLPARPVPPGFGVVRTRLVRPDGSPAVRAALELRLPTGPPVRGYADERGEVAVFVPYPEPAGSNGSPPAGPPHAVPGKLTQQSWDVEVRALLPLDPSPASPTTPPDLCSFAHLQPATLVAGTSELPVVQTLQFGRDLVLPARPATPELTVAPAGSPPS